MTSNRWRVASALLSGGLALASAALFLTRAPSEEACVWVADRDADCVVALDEELYELESWEVSRPTALSVMGGALFVESCGEGEVRWLRLESGLAPVRCAEPHPAQRSEGALELPQTTFPGEPTAWARSRDGLLIATPGAVHLCSEGGELLRAQGGFRWISAIATEIGP